MTLQPKAGVITTWAEMRCSGGAGGWSITTKVKSVYYKVLKYNGWYWRVVVVGVAIQMKCNSNTTEV
jgi:hypothetical protein